VPGAPGGRGRIAKGDRPIERPHGSPLSGVAGLSSLSSAAFGYLGSKGVMRIKFREN
jgi:hypothetical protein